MLPANESGADDSDRWLCKKKRCLRRTKLAIRYCYRPVIGTEKLSDFVCLWYSSADGSSVTVSAPPIPTAPSCVTVRILSWSSRILPLVPFLIGLLTPPPGVAVEFGGRVPELLGAGVRGFAGSWRLWGFDQLGVDLVSGCVTICRKGQPAPSAVVPCRLCGGC